MHRIFRTREYWHVQREFATMVLPSYGTCEESTERRMMEADCIYKRASCRPGMEASEGEQQTDLSGQQPSSDISLPCDRYLHYL